jgi:hypothetical protein
MITGTIYENSAERKFRDNQGCITIGLSSSRLRTNEVRLAFAYSVTPERLTVTVRPSGFDPPS